MAPRAARTIGATRAIRATRAIGVPRAIPATRATPYATDGVRAATWFAIVVTSGVFQTPSPG